MLIVNGHVVSEYLNGMVVECGGASGWALSGGERLERGAVLGSQLADR